jgi:hypothetical protein
MAMEALLEFLQGPLFRFALVVALLGTLAQFTQNAMVLGLSGDGPRGAVHALVTGLRRWLDPVTRLRKNGLVVEVLTWASIAGVVVVPLFYLGHARLWGRTLYLDWPVVPALWSDILTRVTMVTLALQLAARLFDRRVRETWRPTDWLPVAMALSAFVTGYLVAHPGRSPLSPDLTAFLHFASADTLLLALPFTRVSRCVLMPDAWERAVAHRKEVAA